MCYQDNDKKPVALFQWVAAHDYVHAQLTFRWLDDNGELRGFCRTHGLDYLVLHSQGNNQPGETRSLYIIGAEYHQPYTVGLTLAKAMVATLSRIERGMEKANNELGYSDDYAEIARRVCKILGVKEVWFANPRDSRSSFGDWSVEHTLGSAVNRMRTRIWQWANDKENAA